MIITGAVFDMDGTLLDTMGGWTTVGEAYLKSRGIQPLGIPQDSLMVLSMPQVATHFQRTYGLQEDAKTIIDGIYGQMAVYYQTAQPLPGAVAYLDTLKQAGVRICVATATDRALAEPVLRRTGLLPFIERIFTCREVGARKTESRIFDAAREYMGTAKKSTVVFEDAYYAVRTAKAAGYPVCAIADRYESRQEPIKALADVYVTAYEQLSACTKRNAAKALEIRF